MDASPPIPRLGRSVPVWLPWVTWLAVFLSPTGYFLLVIFWNRLAVPALSAGPVVGLFGLIPVVALAICGSAVWRNSLPLGWRVGWLVSTALAMALQVCVLLVIIRAILLTVISYPQ